MFRHDLVGIGSAVSVTNGGVAFVGVNQQTELAYYFITSEHKYHYLFSVNDGDTVLARVYFDASTGLWALHIEDPNTGGFFQQEFSIAPDNRFVDFLLQHPSTNYPLPDFKTINFGPAHWTDSNGNDQPIDSSEAGVETVQETMHDPSGGSACPSDISDDSNGKSYFSVAKC